MVRSIGFLHTSPIHTHVFESLVAEIAPTARAVSVVDESLLELARAAGPDAVEVRKHVTTRIDELVATGVDAIVCTCSTIGAVAELLGEVHGVEIVRVDRAMAERAVEIGGRVVVLAALESTLDPTGRLLSDVAAAAGRTIELRAQLVPGAWDRFEIGDLDGYNSLVMEAIATAAAEADVIVLAQASMAAAADAIVTGVPVLSSPRRAVEALFAAEAQPARRPATIRTVNSRTRSALDG